MVIYCDKRNNDIDHRLDVCVATTSISGYILKLINYVNKTI